MRSILFVLFLSCQVLFAETVKEKISCLLAEVSAKKAENLSMLQFDLARAYLEDQDEENAFKSFSKALDLLSPSFRKADPLELQIFQEALSEYLEAHHRHALLEKSQEIIDKYEKVVEEHPDYYMLNFIIAAAWANLGEYDRFFVRFYDSYKQHPSVFLSYRTRAIIAVKLLERARSSKEREKCRQEILNYLSLASEINPSDTSMYKIWISYANKDSRSETVTLILKRIINNNIITPRKDITFYVRQAVAAKQVDLADQFLKTAKGWYPESRAVEEAQNIIIEAR